MISRKIPCILASVMLLGCSEQPPDAYKGQQSASFDELTPEGHLRCAAMISAYSWLLNHSSIAADPDRSPRLLETLMWHHNAYAIRLGVDERVSMPMVNELREKILSAGTISDIISRAKICIDMVE